MDFGVSNLQITTTVEGVPTIPLCDFLAGPWGEPLSLGMPIGSYVYFLGSKKQWLPSGKLT